MRVLIQHHPSRADLLPRAGRGLGPVEVVEDPDPDGIASAWRSQRACLAAAGPDRVLVVQDDAVPSVGLLSAAEAVAGVHPDRLVSFFHGGVPRVRQEMIAASHRGEQLLELRRGGWVPTVCLMWPPGAAEAFLAWVDEHMRLPLHWRADDSLVGRWAFKTGRGALQTVPCLAEHPDDRPSLLGGRARAGGNRGRVAPELLENAGDWTRCLIGRSRR